MRTGIRRFGEEFFLYSSQFVAFFVFILFVTPDSGSLGIVAAAFVTLFIVIQTMLLVSSGHKVLLRFLYSLITPFGYSLMRAVSGDFTFLEMANVFLWGTAIYSGLFQTAALSATDRRVRRSAEGFLALGAAIIFVFFYYYLNLKLDLERAFKSGEIDRLVYMAALDIRSFPKSFLDFIKTPQHWFPAFGATTFAFMLLSSKMRIISLRARIERLFGSAASVESDTAFVERHDTARNPVEATAAGEHAPSHTRRQPVTIVSSDILGFNDIAERLGPEKAADLLNRYYAMWSVEAGKRDGRIVSVTGDSVIVVFGLEGEKLGAENALTSALAFKEELSGLKDDLASAGLPAVIDVSVGIHTGTIVVGELGPAGRKQLGVFGDAVSIAARLDSLCRELKQDLLVSQATFSRLGLDSQAELDSIGEVLLRKSTHPVPVYGKKQKHH